MKKQYIIDNYTYTKIDNWIRQIKNDDNYLISPLDEDVETANQISYKEGFINEKIRASKCEVVQIHKQTALDFFVKNHRQSPPNMRNLSISFGLVYKNRLISVMTYDRQDGAVRGKKKEFELSRLAIAHGVCINGGASRLQKYCEESLRSIGETQIFSYSNATINNGNVYKNLGFIDKKIVSGQPFVILENNKLERLINLYPLSTNEELAKHNCLKCHISGNKYWVKNIETS